MRAKLVILLLCSLSFTACGQNKTKSSTNNNTMDLSQLTNPTVKSAVEALQANDINAWYAHFTNDAVFTDDGRTLGFKSFFDNAFDKKEKFLNLLSVENDGKNLVGDFYAGQWGTFKVFFHFHVNQEGKIHRLDIGQVK